MPNQRVEVENQSLLNLRAEKLFQDQVGLPSKGQQTQTVSRKPNTKTEIFKQQDPNMGLKLQRQQ